MSEVPLYSLIRKRTPPRTAVGPYAYMPTVGS